MSRRNSRTEVGASAAAALVLWQYPPAFGLPSLSPFCVKIEAVLRLARLPYATRTTNHPRRGPFGKMPVLVDRGEVVADSRAIVAHLARTRQDPLDGWLDPRRRATAHAVQRLVEEHLYFVIMYDRWVRDVGFAACRAAFAGAFPALVAPLALRALRGMLRRQCRGQGLGRLPEAMVYDHARRDVDAIEALLEGPFFFGARPASLDAVLYAFLRTAVVFPAPSPLQDRITGSPRLIDYLATVEAACGFGTAKG
jgi:glutathione S-transferase